MITLESLTWIEKIDSPYVEASVIIENQLYVSGSVNVTIIKLDEDTFRVTDDKHTLEFNKAQVEAMMNENFINFITAEELESIHVFDVNTPTTIKTWESLEWVSVEGVGRQVIEIPHLKWLNDTKLRIIKLDEDSYKVAVLNYGSNVGKADNEIVYAEYDKEKTIINLGIAMGLTTIDVISYVNNQNF